MSSEVLKSKHTAVGRTRNSPTIVELPLVRYPLKNKRNHVRTLATITRSAKLWSVGPSNKVLKQIYESFKFTDKLDYCLLNVECRSL